MSFLENHNVVKQQLEAEQRKTGLFKASENLRMAECNNLKNKVHKTLVSKECLQQAKKRSKLASNSKSKNRSAAMWSGAPQKSAQKDKKTAAIAKRNIELFIACGYRKKYKLLLQGYNFVCSQLSLDSCDSTWHSINGFVDWNPNEVHFEILSVKDWREHGLQSRIDNIWKQITASITTSLGIPLLS